MAQEGHLAGHGHLSLCRGTERTAETERSCLAACLWAQRRNLSRESARNAAPNSSLKLLRVLLQVKLGARLVNSVHQQRLLSFNLSKYSYDICISSTVAVPLQATATIQKLHFWPSNYHIKSCF